MWKPLTTAFLAIEPHHSSTGRISCNGQRFADQCVRALVIVRRGDLVARIPIDQRADSPRLRRSLRQRETPVVLIATSAPDSASVAATPNNVPTRTPSPDDTAAGAGNGDDVARLMKFAFKILREVRKEGVDPRAAVRSDLAVDCRYGSLDIRNHLYSTSRRAPLEWMNPKCALAKGGHKNPPSGLAVRRLSFMRPR